MNDFSLSRFREIDVPAEKAIQETWISGKPLVSIVCTSYNHAQYIDDAIRGFLIQKTDFPFEIIFHDDASTDDTRLIIEKYAAAYPGIIKSVFQERNQYSQGVKILLLSASYASGQYIAFCEGDDFWISGNKLQSQINLMNKFPLAEICFHPSVKLIGDAPGTSLFCKRAKGDKLFDVRPIIRGGGSFMPTASMLFRRNFFDRALADETGFFRRYMMGYCCQIFGSISGGAVYIDRPMAVYRSFSDGSWSQAVSGSRDFYIKWLNSYLAMLRAADNKTNNKFHSDFVATIRRCHLGVLNNLCLDLEFRRRYFNENKAEIGFGGFLAWSLASRSPAVHGLIKAAYSKMRGR